MPNENELDCICCGQTFDKKYLDCDGICEECNREDEMECDECFLPLDECLCDENDLLDDDGFIYGFEDEDLDDDDDFYDPMDDWEGDDWEDDDEDDDAW